ncbi:MAG: cysteine--tRNA ligase [Candidatus Gracilibacteria bacterium]
MALELYSSLSKTIERFKPLRDREVKIYTCGPTVYGFPHIGNYRTYLSWDLVRRTLIFLDYRVTHVMNITDVGHLTDDDILASDLGEDKMEKAAKRENKTVWDIAKFYEEDFLSTLDTLHIDHADHITRATDHIQEMIEMIQILIEKGHAYVTETGVYYDIKSFPKYGDLSGNTLKELQAHASGRVEEREEKHSQHDFVLWVVGKEQTMMWDSPWGRGYPGWHIECSAMAKKYLGDQLDIHGGAVDNKFPHHECEIAQSEGANKKKPFVKYWTHAGHMTVDGEKMSKSKGNIIVPKDIQAKGYTLRTYRLMCLMAHYRSSMDFSWKSMEQSKTMIASFDRFLERVEDIPDGGEVTKTFSTLLNETLGKMVEALEADFNTPLFFSEYFEFMRVVNSMMDHDNVSGPEADATLAFIETIDSVVEVLLPWEEDEVEVPSHILALSEERVKAKQAKDFGKADEIRKQIEEEGFMLEDGKDGTKVRRK